MNDDVKEGQPAPQRKRRTAASARREILDAAQKRLMNEGPDGLRLKVIATDPTVPPRGLLGNPPDE